VFYNLRNENVVVFFDTVNLLGVSKM